jgi:hypothetical protein
VNNEISHVFTPCYLDENLISPPNLNVSFFELRAKNVKECYVTCFLIASQETTNLTFKKNNLVFSKLMTHNRFAHHTKIKIKIHLKNF